MKKTNRLLRLNQYIALSAMFVCLSVISGCEEAVRDILGVHGESCYKSYTFYGTVTDNSANPLDGVDVIFLATTPGVPDSLIDTTGADGIYSFSSINTRATYRGAQFQFVKVGYVSNVSVPYTEYEAGVDRCGDVKVRRDSVMQPV